VLKNKRVDYPQTAKVTAAATWAAPNARISKAFATLLKRLAAMPDSAFVDRKQPSYVRAQRDEIRDYAESIKALQRVRLEVQSKVPGIHVGLKEDLAVVDLDELGYQHELILEVKMPGKKAEADGTLSFQYGNFTVSIDVKKGQTRESIMSRLEGRLQRQQEALTKGASTETSREFLLHRFRPLTAEERKQRDDLIAAHDARLWGAPKE
jgi:hypothetical protein